MKSIKKTVYEIIEEAAPGHRASEIFDIFLITLIALNVVGRHLYGGVPAAGLVLH